MCTIGTYELHGLKSISACTHTGTLACTRIDVHTHTYTFVSMILSAPHSVVFSQGESGVYWYIVLSGSLDVMVADSRDEAKVCRHSRHSRAHNLLTSSNLHRYHTVASATLGPAPCRCPLSAVHLRLVSLCTVMIAWCSLTEIF